MLSTCFRGLCGLTVRTSQSWKLGLRETTDVQGLTVYTLAPVQSLHISSVPFTNLQCGLGPELSPLCLSFLFCKVRVGVGQILSQRAILAPSSRILPSSDTCFSGHTDFPGPPCCCVISSRSSHPHCGPSPVWLEAEGRRNALEPGSHALIKIHLLPLHPLLPSGPLHGSVCFLRFVLFICSLFRNIPVKHL